MDRAAVISGYSLATPATAQWLSAGARKSRSAGPISTHGRRGHGRLVPPRTKAAEARAKIGAMKKGPVAALLVGSFCVGILHAQAQPLPRVFVEYRSGIGPI